MKRPFLLTAPLLFAVAAALLAASPARAQSQPTDRDITIESPVLMKLGTNRVGEANVKSAVAALRRLYPDVNIVTEPGLDLIQIGDIVLHCTEPNLDLEALSIASGRKFICEQDFGKLTTNGGAIAGDSLLVIKANKPPPDAKTEKKVAAFNLGDYFAFKHLGMTTSQNKGKMENEAQNKAEIENQVERLRQIIADTIQALHPNRGGFGGMMAGTEQPLKIEFYPDASLLIAIGSEEDLQAARVVIGALPGMGGGRSSFQQNLRRIRSEQEPAEGKFPDLPAAPPPPQNFPP